jgi:hypothetical protein
VRNPILLSLTSIAAFTAALASMSACSDAVTSPDAAAPATPTPTAPTPTPAEDATAPPVEDAARPDRAVAADVQTRISAYDAALAKAVCAKLTTCCSDADLASYTRQFAESPYKVTTPVTATSCEAVLKESFDALYLKKWGVSVSVGNIEFSDARAATCLDGVQKATCGGALIGALFDAACFGVRGNEVFKKVGKLGAPCDDIGDTTFIGECDPALGYCGEAKRCVPWRGTGEDCGILVQDAGPARRLFCAPGTNCDGGSIRAPGKCSGPAKSVGLGEACTSLSGPDLLCPANAYCDFLGSGRCAARKADGQACQSDDECASARAYSCYASTSGDGGLDAGGPRSCGSTAFCGGR